MLLGVHDDVGVEHNTTSGWLMFLVKRRGHACITGIKFYHGQISILSGLQIPLWQEVPEFRQEARYFIHEGWLAASSPNSVLD